MNLRRSGRKLGHGEINRFDQSLLIKVMSTIASQLKALSQNPPQSSTLL